MGNDEEKVIDIKNFLEVLKGDGEELAKKREQVEKEQDKIKEKIVSLLLEQAKLLNFSQSFLEELEKSQKRNDGLLELIRGLNETTDLPPSIEQMKKSEDFLVRLEERTPYCFFYLLSSDSKLEFSGFAFLLSGELICLDKDDLLEEQALTQDCVCGKKHVIVAKICVSFQVIEAVNLSNSTEVSLWLPCYRKGAIKIGTTYKKSSDKNSLEYLKENGRIEIG